jgi:hypothetical protein
MSLVEINGVSNTETWAQDTEQRPTTNNKRKQKRKHEKENQQPIINN